MKIHCETARRELIEETGYRAGRLELLHSFFLSPGILDERMYLFLASDLTSGRCPARSVRRNREPGRPLAAGDRVGHAAAD